MWVGRGTLLLYCALVDYATSADKAATMAHSRIVRMDCSFVTDSAIPLIKPLILAAVKLLLLQYFRD